MASSWQDPETELAPAAVIIAVPAEAEQNDWEFILKNYVMMLATVVVTVTYSVGFKPPGGVWQDNMQAAPGAGGGHLAGESIIQTTNKLRYLVFFYFNAFALASSVLAIVLFFLLPVDIAKKKKKMNLWIQIKPIRILMGLDLLSFMGAYAAGSCGDTLTSISTSVLMAAGVLAYLTVQMVQARRRLESPPPLPPPPPPDEQDTIHGEEWLRKALMLMATFAVSITYVAGLSSPPGGFRDNTEGGHRPGDAVLGDGHHKARLATFFICNTMAFMASLLIIMLLLGRKLHKRTARSRKMLGCVIATMVGLVGAYAAGSCRNAADTAYVVLVVLVVAAACLVFILVLPIQYSLPMIIRRFSSPANPHHHLYDIDSKSLRRARSFLLLLSTFATAITYPAGLAPPGGVWQDNRDGHLAGDPILLKKNTIRYNLFYYCNSISFVASLLTIFLFMTKWFLKSSNVVETLMVLELFGLVGAYAAGACRDVGTSIYVVGLGGAVLLYVVLHIIFLSNYLHGDNPSDDDDISVYKKRKLMYLLATLTTAMSYQAGLNPPGGFWLQETDDAGSGGRSRTAGDPVLLYNHPRHHNVFFYCNSLSFMMSITTMILLMTRVLYTPAIRSYALTLCSVGSLSCLLGAYAAGSTQKITTSVGISTLVALAFFILIILLIIFLVKDQLNRIRNNSRRRWTTTTMASEGEHDQEQEDIIKNTYAKRKNLMLLGILVAGVTYQCGLDPAGGVWQSDAGGHDVGGPTMQDNRRQRYLAFFYSNSTSFAASIFMLSFLLLQQLLAGKKEQRWHISSRVMVAVIMLDLLALLVAYATGSNRDIKSSLLVAALSVIVLTYIAIKVMLSFLFLFIRIRLVATREQIQMPSSQQLQA